MNLLIEAVERRGSSLEHEFPINPYDLQEIFDKLGKPVDWLKPVVIQYEPEIRVVQIENEGPQPTRKPYEFASGYVVPPDVSAGKLGKREWRLSMPSDDLWDNPGSPTADIGDLVRVARQRKAEILLATIDEVDPLLDGTALFLEPYKGSYLDRGDTQAEETTAAVTFCEDAPYGMSFIPTERKSQLSALYTAVPLSSNRVHFQGVIHFNKEGDSRAATFELVDRNIVTGETGLVDPGKQLHDAKSFFTEPHPTHPETTPFLRLTRKGRFSQ